MMRMPLLPSAECAISMSAIDTPSSLASVVNDAEHAAQAAKAAKDESTSMARRYTIGGAIAGVVGLATIVALAIQVLTLRQTPAPATRTVVRLVKASPTPASLGKRLTSLQLELRRVERLNKLHR